MHGEMQQEPKTELLDLPVSCLAVRGLEDGPVVVVSGQKESEMREDASEASFVI